MIFDLLMALGTTRGARWCRVCTDAIDRRDAFAMSEGVCRSCGG